MISPNLEAAAQNVVRTSFEMHEILDYLVNFGWDVKEFPYDDVERAINRYRAALKMYRTLVDSKCSECLGTGIAPGCGHGQYVKHVVDCGTTRPCEYCRNRPKMMV